MKNKETIEDLLNRSLFLFGAGGTKDAGCLTSADMLRELESNSEFKDVREALHFLLSSLEYHGKWKTLKDRAAGYPQSYHSANIEDLVLLIRRIIHRDSFLPYPVTGSWADKINFLEIAYQSNKYDAQLKETSLFEHLQQILTYKLFDWLCVGKEDHEYLQPISNFLKALPESDIHLDFFSLNYDLVFERHFNSNDETLLNTGFISNKFAGFDNKESNNTRINYYKLHGSLNWQRTESGDVISLDPNRFDESQYEKPHIIFGHGGKFLSVDPFLSLLYEFKNQLEKKEIYFVIGYSFFDPYINNLILNGLSIKSNRPKKMIIINPSFSARKLIAKDKNLTDKDQNAMRTKFMNMVQGVQQSTYLSEQPDFNVTEVSIDLFDIIPDYAKAYIKKLFAPDGSGFIQLNEQLHRESEEPF